MARPRTYDDTVRARLLDATSAAIARGGPATVSLRSVAGAAETTTAAVYALFGNREGLIDAVVDEGFRRFATHLAVVPRTEDPYADLLALGIAYRANAVENPHFYRVMFAPVGDPNAPARVLDAGQGIAASTFGVLRDAVARVTGAGPAQSEAIRLWALVHGLVSLELAGLLPGDPGERERSYIATLRAVRAAGEM